MTTAEDRLKYPNYFYDPYLKSLSSIEGTDKVNERWTAHHFIRQQWIRNNPEKFEKVKHLQKIIFLPTFVSGFNNMHAEAHNGNRDFKEHWGFELDEIRFNEDGI